MNKKQLTTLSVSTSVTIALGFSSAVMANTATNVINNAINLGKDALYTDAPDWMQRTSIELQVEKNFKPTIELETVQPIMQNSKDDMMFYQLNARTRDSKKSYNAGLGYRNIVADDMMYGINAFYDYSAENKHKRSSIGVEAISNDLEARANIYNAISNKKEVKTNEFEQALDGWDVEVGGSILPMDKNLKVYLSHSEFEAVTTGRSDYKDNQVRATYPLNNNTMLEVGHTMEKEKYGSKEKNRSFAKIKYTFGNQSSGKSAEVGLRTKLLQPVERRHEIVLEKTINASVTISRGT
ncbi:MAG: inverse autotransporter beta domain-containing protein [Proteobacteria bacterium]|nr:inverse autotransporter beta domain-containing protein [Pseudomonadota bacterium]MCH9712029.1 inverse autotransporter beta domain-containing protein [Pseudomonadota bacterium]MCH9750033.1 inverse autotransporter beta domain-containing protein [Pseudomonadota bacterium]